MVEEGSELQSVAQLLDLAAQFQGPKRRANEVVWVISFLFCNIQMRTLSLLSECIFTIKILRFSNSLVCTYFDGFMREKLPNTCYIISKNRNDVLFVTEVQKLANGRISKIITPRTKYGISLMKHQFLPKHLLSNFRFPQSISIPNPAKFLGNCG